MPEPIGGCAAIFQIVLVDRYNDPINPLRVNALEHIHNALRDLLTRVRIMVPAHSACGGGCSPGALMPERLRIIYIKTGGAAATDV